MPNRMTAEKGHTSYLLSVRDTRGICGGRRPRHFAARITVAGVAVVVLSVAPADESGPRSDVAESGYGHTCGGFVSVDTPLLRCIQLPDRADRRPLTAHQQAAGGLASRKLLGVVAYAGFCTTPADQSCSAPPPQMPLHRPTPADVAVVRDAIAHAGYANFVVRLAREHDISEHGSLIYAVSVDEICAFGVLHYMPGGPGAQMTSGPLPDGKCLD
ncbi:hypothetical protein GCM10010532_113790 [Dactylosporangium siamense]|uniref:Uncharacterized protein n=1 Tax=Dactylosporangium siamense TaxID=685454 RepID=A0A919PUC5_9ACTN|nr:hypothetical protein Dsi01nite_079180 [Dactylosporangium siamense]